MEQLGPLVWPCLEKGKERRREDVSKRKRKREREKKFKDDIRSLDG